MTILLNIDIFPSILKKLPLHKLVSLRRVCKQWKGWIDEYLKRQKVLMIMNLNDDYKALTAVSQTLDINFSQICFNIIYTMYLKMSSGKAITESLIRTFPQVEELYIFVEEDFDDEYGGYRGYGGYGSYGGYGGYGGYGDYGDYGDSEDSENSGDCKVFETLDYVGLLSGWESSLKKLIMADLNEDLAPKITKCLNKCGKLETFGVIVPVDEEGNELKFAKSEKFLGRLTSLWIPSSEPIQRLGSFPNIAGIAGIRHDEVSASRFPNVQRFYLLSFFFPDELNRDLCDKLQDLQALGHKNLSFLEIEIRYFDGELSQFHWMLSGSSRDRDSDDDESMYPPFSNQMNRFSGVKTLKFEFEKPACLKYVLENCASFDHVETLVINYKYRDSETHDGEVLELPSNFVELLPKRVNRIQKMEFHLEEPHCEGFKKTDFSAFPYKVKILHDL